VTLIEVFAVGAVFGASLVVMIWCAAVWFTPQRRARLFAFVRSIGTIIAAPFVIIALGAAFFAIPFFMAREAYIERDYVFLAFMLVGCASVTALAVQFVSYLLGAH
jgi:hypothetical protein